MSSGPFVSTPWVMSASTTWWRCSRPEGMRSTSPPTRRSSQTDDEHSMVGRMLARSVLRRERSATKARSSMGTTTPLVSQDLFDQSAGSPYREERVSGSRRRIHLHHLKGNAHLSGAVEGVMHLNVSRGTVTAAGTSTSSVPLGDVASATCPICREIRSRPNSSAYYQREEAARPRQQARRLDAYLRAELDLMRRREQ